MRPPWPPERETGRRRSVLRPAYRWTVTEKRDELVVRLVEGKRLWRLLDDHSCSDCARPRKPEYAQYATCYDCGQLRSRYGPLRDLVPITYTTRAWRLGRGLQSWKDSLGTSPTSPVAPWF